MHMRNAKVTMHATNALPPVDKNSIKKLDAAIRKLEQSGKTKTHVYDMGSNSIDCSELRKEGLAAYDAKVEKKQNYRDAKAQGKLLSIDEKKRLKASKAQARKEKRLAGAS